MEIKIRHSEKEDIASIKALYEEPSCSSGTLQFPYMSIEAWEKRLGGDKPDNFHSLVAIVNQQLVGHIGLEVYKNRRRSHVANFGMGVSEKYQEKGVGSSLLSEMLRLATDWLAVRRIELEVYTDNLAGIALYKKFGFEIEGTAKQYAFRNGTYVDAYLMAKL